MTRPARNRARNRARYISLALIATALLGGCVPRGSSATTDGGTGISMPDRALDNSSWRLTAINGSPAAEGVDADIQFADGQISGSLGCNRIGGSYAQDGDRLRFGPIMMTKMACPGPVGAQEDAALPILAEPLTVLFGENMTLDLSAADGRSLSFRRLDWD